MSDLTDDVRHLIREREIEDYHAAGPNLLREHANSLTRLNRISLSLNAALMVITLLLAASIIVMVPLQRRDPLYVAVTADGLPQTVHDISELGERKRDDVIKSVLWTAVRSCEEYYYEIKKRNYATCSALLSGKAQAEYQNRFNNDPSSPQYKIRDRGHVDIREIPKSADLKDNIDACRDKDWCEASLSYWRSEHLIGQAPTAERHYTAQVAFVLVDQLDSGDSETVNPAALKIISYHTDCDDCGS